MAAYTLVHVLISLVGDRLRLRGCVRTPHIPKAQPLDRTVPGDHGGDERDRVRLSIRAPVAVAYRRHHFAVVLAITIPARYTFRLAGARRWIYEARRGARLLFQFLRAAGAALQEGAGAGSNRTD